MNWSVLVYPAVGAVACAAMFKLLDWVERRHSYRVAVCVAVALLALIPATIVGVVTA